MIDDNPLPTDDPISAPTYEPDYNYDGPILGGISDGDESSLAALDAAEFVHEKLHSNSYLSDSCSYFVDEVLDFSEQVVAGTLTRVQFEIESDRCEDKVCEAEIWEKSWEGFKEVQNYAKGLKIKNLKIF